MKKKNNKRIGKMKQVMIGIIIFTMISTSFAVVNADGPNHGTVEVPSIRTYGQELEPYPNQAWIGSWLRDFIYKYGEDPFDPGILAKDSITFNPAFIDMEYNGKEITVSDNDASEKIFLRLFYQPSYWHPKDRLMNKCSDSLLEPIEMFHGVVLETTYFLVTKTNHPIPGKPGTTQFVLPYKSSDPDTPGMDTADVVFLDEVKKPYMKEGGGKIKVKYAYEEIESGEENSFMDHTFKFINYQTDLDKVKIKVRYDGNMYGAHSKEKTCYLKIGETYYFDRNNNFQTYSDPCHRWYLKVKYYHDGNIDVDVGRVLTAGETFYVNGVRYDMPAIFVEKLSKTIGDGYGFKYITFQTPLPKCDTQMWFKDDLDDNVNDWSHVTSQWLANLLPEEPVWLLPPFNEKHIMIDDIGLTKVDNGHWCDKIWMPDWEVPETGLILEEIKDELLFWYVDEDIEPRFNSSLTELLSRCDDYEFWSWASVYTLPNRYTEFILPDQEIPDESYENTPKWYPSGADGSEYLLTSSFVVDNSKRSYDRWHLSKCKSTYHEIYDRVLDLFSVKEEGEDEKVETQRQMFNIYYGMPRLTFEYDAADDTDLYINEKIDQGVSLRVYGEDNYIYPTHSWSANSKEWFTFCNQIYKWRELQGDFIYPHDFLSFYPGAIPKDSVTFNPAFIEMDYDGHEIIVNNGNSNEKIFLRMFYEPGFYHGVDGKMKTFSDSELEPVEKFDSVVLETSYFLLDHDRYPVAGKSDDTWFMLPYYSADPDTPGMDAGGLVQLTWADDGQDFDSEAPKVDVEGFAMDSQILTDGCIEVEKLFEGIVPGEQVSFMDHSFEFDSYETTSNKIKLKVKYDGNMYGAHDVERVCHLDIGEKYYFTRANNFQKTSDPAHRWYVEVVYYHENGEQTIDVEVGRRLCAGETFYVDGVRYDMPAVYVTDFGETDFHDYRFKYITFQTPIPKCPADAQMWYTDILDDNVNDWSHVTSQWLANLRPNDIVWLLPPFNHKHMMIDDIGLEKINNGKCFPDYEVPYAGLIVKEEMDPLEFYYIDEDIEHRFDSSLSERFYPECDAWRWWSIHDLPNRYTEFILPNQEKTTNMYREESRYDWYTNTYADGNEYLLASNWLAPNCLWPDFKLSKFSYMAHDIFDINHLIRSLFDQGPIRIRQKVAFEFDAEDGTGIYINKQKVDGNGNGDDELPTADGNGPYYECGGCINFDASASYDNDESGFEIVEYKWDFNNDGTYDTAWMPFSDPYYEYCYTDDYDGYAKLLVKDNEEDTDTDLVEVTFVSGCADTTLKMEDVDIHTTEDGYGRLLVDDVANLGSFQITITYDTDLISAINVRDSDFGTLSPVIDDTAGEIHLNAYSSTGKTGDFIIAYIDFTFDEGDVGDTSPLTIANSQLFDATSTGVPIAHNKDHGVATIVSNSQTEPVECDFDGNKLLNINDVRYLAMHLNFHEDYTTLNGCNPNIDCQGGANIVDVRYLAMHLNFHEDYDELYPNGCSAWL